MRPNKGVSFRTTVSSQLDWEIRGVDGGRGWCGEGGQKRRLLCGCSKMAAQAGKPAEELWSLGLGSAVNWCSGVDHGWFVKEHRFMSCAVDRDRLEASGGLVSMASVEQSRGLAT
ncbi:hypothetical protein M0R45_036904 [Rubus argutus]|uniref:Uncharacterized protein n=1 Tax=Rubus argutus TaxID=59490 RepID=A0AAW1W0F0_RUBAR